MKVNKIGFKVLGIISVVVIFSISFVLNRSQTDEDTVTKNNTSQIIQNKENESKLVQTEETKNVYNLNISTDDVNTKEIKYSLQGLPQDIIEYINSNRITSSLSEEEMEKKFKNYLYSKYTNCEEGFDKIPKDDGVKTLHQARPNYISLQAAEEDVDYLFTNLKYGYSAYEYFGGDEKFNKAKDKILKDLKSSEKDNNDVSTKVFNQILLTNLNFIKDGHFSINGKQTFKYTYAFMNKDEIIVKGDKGFCIEINNKKYHIVSIENSDPNNYIKPSIDDDGEIIYRICYLKDTYKNSIDISLIIKDKETEIQKNILLYKVFANYGGEPYTFKEIEGIPVFKVTTFYRNCEDKLEKLSADALKYSDSNIAILDLRGNNGGSCIYGWNWISNFTNISVDKLNMICTGLNTKIAQCRYLNELMYFESDKSLNNQNKIKKRFLQESDTDVSSHIIGWEKIDYSKLDKLENDKVIIVLFDKYCGSAAEGIISNLNYIDNVIFIGNNSYGALNSCNVGCNVLPNSKFLVSAGTALCIEPDFVWREGIGYFPDFWVDSEGALDKTIKFINNYIKCTN